MIDYYATLGVPRTATSTEIRDAYLRAGRDTHPDKVKNPEARKKAEDVFKNVTAAYDTLSKDRSRRDYSSKLPNNESWTPPAQKAAPPMVKGPPLPPKEGRAGAPQEPVPAAATPMASSGRVEFDALGQGIEALKKKDYHTAVQLLNLAVSNDEGNARAHATLALAMAKNPNWVRDAMNHMETASKIEPKNVSYLVEYALLLHSQGLKLRAKRALESAMALKPDHPDVARALKEIPIGAEGPETPRPTTAETPRGIFDRLRKR